jgi:chromosome segregation and condensation protein ScpB
MGKNKSGNTTSRKTNWSPEHSDVILRAAAEGLSARHISTAFKFPDRSEEDVINKFNNLRKRINEERQLILDQQKEPTKLCPDGLNSSFLYQYC